MYAGQQIVFARTDPGGWMGWLATHHEWSCNYSDMQIKALHY